MKENVSGCFFSEHSVKGLIEETGCKLLEACFMPLPKALNVLNVRPFCRSFTWMFGVQILLAGYK